MSRSRFDDVQEFPRRARFVTLSTVCCPCIELGRIESQLAHEKIGRCGLGKLGRTKCLKSFFLCFPSIFCFELLKQRRKIMARYGIRGYCTQCICCYPYALSQHASLLAEIQQNGFERFPWEKAHDHKISTTEKKLEFPSFDVIAIGAKGAGVSSFVHAAIGAKPPINNSRYDQITNQVIHPRQFSVGTRIVPSNQDFPTTILDIWDLPANADLELPIDFVLSAHAVVAVFDADRHQSLQATLDRYDSIFSSNKVPSVRILLGNVHRDRSRDDFCEFIDAVHQAAESRNMEAMLVALHTHTAKGTKRLLERIVEHIWLSRYKNNQNLQQESSNLCSIPGDGKGASEHNHATVVVQQPQRTDHNKEQDSPTSTLITTDR